MNVSYTGIGQGLPQRLQAKLDTKLQKARSWLIEGPLAGACRSLQAASSLDEGRQAEVTMQFFGLIRWLEVQTDPDLFTAISGAIDHLEKQTSKESARWRDARRAGVSRKPVEEAAAPQAGVEEEVGVEG